MELQFDRDKLRDGIEKLHAVLIKENIRDTESLWPAKFVYDKLFDMNKFFDVFRVSRRHPKIVSQNEYNTSFYTEMYSGAQYINAAISQFQTGDFRANEYGLYGIGYYFSSDISIASCLNTIDHARNDVMCAKIILSRARIGDLLDLDIARYENIPQTSEDYEIRSTDDYEKKAKIISRLFDYDAHKSIWALLFGYDGITERKTSIVNVINRDIVIQTKEPVMR